MAFKDNTLTFEDTKIVENSTNIEVIETFVIILPGTFSIITKESEQH